MRGPAKALIAFGCACFMVFGTATGWAESGGPPLEGWHDAREVRLDTGMATLLGWGLANTVAGVAGRLATDDRRMRGFWEMNAGWGLVNTALAALSLATDHADAATRASLGASLEAAHDLSVIFWVNTGLDVAWMAIGGWLWDRGHLKGDARTVGFGQSMVLQGAFLFGFDLVMALLEQDAASDLMPFIGPSGAGLAIRF